MADPTPEQLQVQYAAIERLYSEGQWSEVLQASEALLAVVQPLQGHPLRPRLQLVMGHTLLYGLHDLNGAEQHYRTVLRDTQQPVLRDIAEQGLNRCSEQREAVVQPLEAMAAASASRAAMPWLADLGGDFSAAAGDGGDSTLSSSVRSVRNAETPNGQQAVEAEAKAIPEPLPAAQETLVLLRAPEPEANPHPPAVEAVEQVLTPPPAQEEPPLSPEQMAELARGLLEMVLP